MPFQNNNVVNLCLQVEFIAVLKEQSDVDESKNHMHQLVIEFYSFFHVKKEKYESFYHVI